MLSGSRFDPDLAPTLRLELAKSNSKPKVCHTKERERRRYHTCNDTLAHRWFYFRVQREPTAHILNTEEGCSSSARFAGGQSKSKCICARFHCMWHTYR